MRRRLLGLVLPLALLACSLESPASQLGAQPLRRIAFGSCAHQERPQPIWETIVGTKPELFLFLGDNIYGDTEDMDLMKAKYGKLAAMPGYQKLLKTCPILATWDDHDYGANDAGAGYPKKVESQRLFLDFFNVKDTARRTREGVYHAETFGPPGQRVQVILLDTRYHRSPLQKKAGKTPQGVGPYEANNDPKTTILGEAQWRWLEDQLRQPAEIRLIGSSIQVVAEDHGWEKWMNFPHERERLFKLIRDTKAAGVLFLSGDRHLGELSLMDGGAGYPMYDLTSSGLNQASKIWRRQEENRHRVATMNYGDHFGFIAIDWDRNDPRISMQIRDEEGEIVLQQKVGLSRLQPGKTVAVAGGLAEEAMKHLGKEWKTEMRVASTGQSKTQKLVFLNSEANFSSPGNFTVVLDAKVAALLREQKITDPAEYYRGKTLRVTGKVSEFNKRPQIVLTDPKQIEIVEKK